MDEVDKTFDRLRRPSLFEMASLTNEFIHGSDVIREDSREKRIKSWAENYRPNDQYSYLEEPGNQVQTFYKMYGWTWKEIRKAAFEYLARRNF